MSKSTIAKLPAERILIVDWSYGESILTAFERKGSALTMIGRRVIASGRGAQAVAACAIQMCRDHSCTPLVDVTGMGEAIHNTIIAGLG